MSEKRVRTWRWRNCRYTSKIRRTGIQDHLARIGSYQKLSLRVEWCRVLLWRWENQSGLSRWGGHSSLMGLTAGWEFAKFWMRSKIWADETKIQLFGLSSSSRMYSIWTLRSTSLMPWNAILSRRHSSDAVKTMETWTKRWAKFVVGKMNELKRMNFLTEFLCIYKTPPKPFFLFLIYFSIRQLYVEFWQ